MRNRDRWMLSVVLAAALVPAGASFGADGDVASELSALKQRIADLEKKESENWLTEERKSEIRSIVKEVIDDARQRGQFADGPAVGYKDGFYITDGANYKLTVGGFVQARYTYGRHDGPLASRQVGTAGVGNPAVRPTDPGDANGFDVRRARVNFSGYVVSKDLTYKLEGDFYGGTSGSGSFTVTDAFIAYRLYDYLRVKAGSFKAPFAKAELTSDTNLGMLERPEVLAPFDPIRSIGLSVYGDIDPDVLGYEVNINNGQRTNLLKGVDTYATSSNGARPTANLDNRLAFYARIGWAGAGKLSDFNDEPDLRSGDRPFVWMLGAAGGYESQNSTNNAFPAPQTTTTGSGQSTADSPGFLANQTLNGDLFRGTVDWSGKVGGWSLLAAGYFQQSNYNEGAVSSTNGSTVSVPSGYGASDGSYFQYGGYGQVGYMVTDKWEVVGRAGVLATEGYPNFGEFYTLGTNYYFFKHNAKIMADITYAPEAAYTDASAALIQNTHEFVFRVQFQLKF